MCTVLSVSVLSGMTNVGRMGYDLFWYLPVESDQGIIPRSKTESGSSGVAMEGMETMATEAEVVAARVVSSVLQKMGNGGIVLR